MTQVNKLHPKIVEEQVPPVESLVLAKAKTEHSQTKKAEIFNENPEKPRNCE